RFGHEVEHEARDRDVARLRLDRERLGVADLEPRARVANPVAHPGDIGLGAIDPGDRARRRSLEDDAAQRTGPAADIEPRAAGRNLQPVEEERRDLTAPAPDVR